MRRSQLPGCLPFFDKTLFSLVYGSAPFPKWGPSQCLSTETQREQGDALSRQGKLMPVILLLPPQPVSVPGSQKALNIAGLRKHCFSWRLCTIVSVSCLLWEAAFLDSYCLQNGDPVPVKQFLSRCCSFQTLAQLCPDHNQLYWSHKCTFSKLRFIFTLPLSHFH